MLTKSNYLDLIGIQEWQVRTHSAPAVLIPHHISKNAQWLFILEKQEVTQDSPLLHAIFAAIKQSINTVAIAYYDTVLAETKAPDLSHICYVVLMGDEALATFQAQRKELPQDIAVIISANLHILDQDITAKRTLWQQLKQNQT
ncbi:MAG: DNA polymerase III subunit psi [Gammaproteobacteria bacterium]|jgi:DNA polymerase III psi subunit